MMKNCIRCKREISSSQANCLACGAPQNYFIHYFKTALVFFVLICAALAAAYWYENQPEKLAELTRLRALANNASDSQAKIEQLETSIEQANSKLKSTQEELDLLEKNSSAKKESISKRNTEFEKNKARAFKAEKRALWLSKENGRLKIENKSLSEQLLTFQADPNSNSNSNSNSSDQLVTQPVVKPSAYPKGLEAAQESQQTLLESSRQESAESQKGEN